MKNVIIKKLKYPCYICNDSIRGKTKARKKCAMCDGTGQFRENHYFFLTNEKGQIYAIDGDTYK